jgi:hypothetical protein
MFFSANPVSEADFISKIADELGRQTREKGRNKIFKRKDQKFRQGFLFE